MFFSVTLKPKDPGLNSEALNKTLYQESTTTDPGKNTHKKWINPTQKNPYINQENKTKNP